VVVVTARSNKTFMRNMEILTTWVSRELTSELTTLAGTPNSAGIENQRC